MYSLKFKSITNMQAAVKNKIVYKIKLMKLTYFNVKNFVFVLVCFIICMLFFNTLNALDWKAVSFRDPTPANSVNANVFVKNDELSFEVYKIVQEVTQCHYRPLKPFVQRRGDFWVLHNYVRAGNQHRCFESVTYTTQGDYTFLDNIMPLVERWRGPISVALHSPGDDFQPTLDSIAYLRNCETPLVKQYVTFHLFFGTHQIPRVSTIKALRDVYEDTYDCSKGAPYKYKDYKALYKTKQNLTYPINVARNIARITAQTHFVLASDIELYPSLNLISKFLLMVAQRRELFEDGSPKVFVVPVFEIFGNQSVPQDKTVLRNMVKAKTAFTFHRNICLQCHQIPSPTNWINLPETDNLNIFMAVKRQGIHAKWEAFYIGTHDEPLFDERLTWEGQSNKMIQAYTLCLLNYDYMVLDNAFLVHKPGVKTHKLQIRNHLRMVWETNRLISTQIKFELNSLFGARNGCLIQ